MCRLGVKIKYRILKDHGYTLKILGYIYAPNYQLQLGDWMDLRHLFINNTWWGKLIGAFFGFLIAGPVGAFFGILVGNFFDKGLSLHLTQPFWYYQNERNTKTKTIFFKSLFAMLGHIAKADGHVSVESIQFTHFIMTQMKLNEKQKHWAKQYFTEGKTTSYKYTDELSTLYKQIKHNPNLIRLFVETQYQHIKKVGLSDKKLSLINQMLINMRIAPLHQHRHFFDDFARRTHYESPFGGQQRQGQNYHYQPRNERNSLQASYSLLGLQPNCTQQEVKRSYRKLISKHHPDKLIAKGESAQMIKLATEKTQQIQKAYALICEQRGWP